MCCRTEQNHQSQGSFLNEFLTGCISLSLSLLFSPSREGERERERERERKKKIEGISVYNNEWIERKHFKWIFFTHKKQTRDRKRGRKRKKKKKKHPITLISFLPTSKF